ncbi:MAG: ABC transporter ATP-binding protein [Acidaminococcales bacterium]|nr:ABC transporter ATP-binding protein [Acidaminococcales bacterium]
MLDVREVGKLYGGRYVLRNINFQVQDGEILSMLGPSGSGKTTLLNIILGIVRMDEGYICFDYVDISDVPMEKRGFNIVFQDYALFPNLNAYENITYGLRNNPSSMTAEELDSLIDFLELRPHLPKKIFQLSGGQKQRVALARTLVTRPKILLLDEPLSALDGIIKETIKERIKAITKKFNLTTIIVTHDPEEALTMSDKVLIIEKGEVAQCGTPREIVSKPENDFIESFILRQLQVKRDNIYNLFSECHA